MLTKAMQWSWVLALSAGTLAAQTATPVAVPEHLRTSGMVGLAEGQTAQLNLLAPRVLVAPTATAAMCPATVTFLDNTGKVLKTATVTVPPDQSVAFELDSDADLQMASGTRTEIRATLQVEPAATPGTPAIAQFAACRLVPTLEVFNTTTKQTTLVVTRFHRVRLPAVTPAPTDNSPAHN